MDGYDDAVLDAADPEQPGLELVLTRMTDLMKSRQRERYHRWIAARHIDPVDWGTKCAMAHILLERCRHRLPTTLRECSPPQMADHVLELLTLDLGTDHQVDRALCDADQGRG